jgi:hypothetical protein
MSNNIMAVVVTTVIIAIFFAWIPLLNFVCPPCGRFFGRRRFSKDSGGLKIVASKHGGGDDLYPMKLQDHWLDRPMHKTKIDLMAAMRELGK